MKGRRRQAGLRYGRHTGSEMMNEINSRGRQCSQLVPDVKLLVDCSIDHSKHSITLEMVEGLRSRSMLWRERRIVLDFPCPLDALSRMTFTMSSQLRYVNVDMASE